jgi:hypothetical protein
VAGIPLINRVFRNATSVSYMQFPKKNYAMWYPTSGNNLARGRSAKAWCPKKNTILSYLIIEAWPLQNVESFSGNILDQCRFKSYKIPIRREAHESVNGIRWNKTKSWNILCRYLVKVINRCTLLTSITQRFSIRHNSLFKPILFPDGDFCFRSLYAIYWNGNQPEQPERYLSNCRQRQKLYYKAYSSLISVIFGTSNFI